MTKLKRAFFFIALAIFLNGCLSKNQNSEVKGGKAKTVKSGNRFDVADDTFGLENAVIHLDISKFYPSKKIVIQDIANVEYIALERKDSNFFTGPIVAITEDKFIGYSSKEGTITIFAKTGQILKIINHQGRGPQEYYRLNGLAYDSINNELFVSDILHRKILVYDGDGNYKRSFSYLKERIYFWIVTFNDTSLLCWDMRSEHPATFFLISKSDGTNVKDLPIFNSKKISPFISGPAIQEKTMIKTSGFGYFYKPAIFPADGILLNDISSDTIFKLTFDCKLKPFSIRIPSIVDQDPIEYLTVWSQARQYTFFQSVDLSGVKGKLLVGIEDIQIPTNEFLYDAEDGKTYRLELINRDHETYKFDYVPPPISANIAAKRLDAYLLVEAYQNGELKGELKEIASTLDENDNPILMIIRYKTYGK